jgi:acetyl esterase/lipase
MKLLRQIFAGAGALALFAGIAPSALAQVPPDIAAQLKALGRTVDPKAMEIYAPLHSLPPYAGITVARDLPYGDDPLQKLDVFTPDKPSPHPRAVMVFVHGGGFVRGDKARPGSPFNDNMVVWAAKHDLVGVNINYRLSPKDAWPSGPEDIAAVVHFIHENAARFGADPNRIFLWGHSAGANHVADYVAHPEFHGPNGPGIAGAILMSGIYEPQTNGYYGADPAKVAQRVPGLLKTRVPLMVITAELDPPMMSQSANSLKAALCAEGRCPAFVFAKDADHMSEGLAVGTADVSVSDPVLKFIQETPARP